MKHFLKYLIVILAIVAVSCNNSDDNPPFDTGKEYFPLRQGLFQIYDVTEIQYTLGVPESFRYELKTVVTDSFPNAKGNFSYIIHRSKRNEGETEFTYFDTWSARINNREVIVNEENISYLKFTLPIRQGASWDGNVYNSIGTDTYAMEEIKKTISIDGEIYPDCIVVNQEDNEDFVVFLDKRNETYARNIGLISKEVTMLQYCSVGPCLGQQQVESGMIFIQTIKAHGVE